MGGKSWWASTDQHHHMPPRRLLIAFSYFIFKPLNRFRAGKGGQLQVPEVKYPKAGDGRVA